MQIIHGQNGQKVLKVDYGQKEFIELFGRDPREYLTTVTKVNADKDGNVESVDTVKVEWKKDANGRFAPVPVEGSEKNYKADLILLAMGFTGSEDYLKNAFAVESDARSNVQTQDGSYKTNVPKIFTTGDARSGQSLVVRAIADGIAAGEAVDKFLRS